MPREWGQTDLSFGVGLCKGCARKRRVSPPVRNDNDLAARLTMIEINIKNEVRTAQALLKGTEYEEESRDWGRHILAALEAPFHGGPARTMVTTIASIRRRVFKVGE